MDSKQELKEILQYAIFKLDNNLCTSEEIDSCSDVAKSTLNLEGTAPDIAKFYGVTEHQVRNTINRKMLSKPRRRVYYRFQDFMKIAPEKWRK